MSWLISLIVAGAVLASGSSIPNFESHNNTIHKTSLTGPVVLDEMERFEKTYQFDPNGKIEVSNVNGSIKIEAWDRNEIKFSYVKVADTRERLADLEVKIDAQSSHFKVKTDYEKLKQKKDNNKWKKGSKLHVDFALTVPRTARLEQIESVNGSVTVADMTSYSEISAVNGTVKATNLRGTADLSTVNGTVYADFDQLDQSSSVKLQTVNGSVRLFIPSDSNATVKADTMMGSIKNDFQLPVRKGKFVGRGLYGKIGNGDVKITCSSVNGGISINRKQDGKKLSPSTNLLKIDRRGNDEDGDVIEIDLGDALKEVDVSSVEAMKEARKAIEEVRKGMDSERVTQIEVEKITRKALKDAEKALKDIKIKELKIDRKELEKRIKEAEKAKLEALKDLSGAVYYGPAPFVEEKSESFDVVGVPTVEIDARDCSVAVRGWNKNKVRYSVTRIQREGPKRPVLIKTQKEGKLRIVVESEASAKGVAQNEQLRLEVFVPKKSNLEILTHRELRLEGVSGNIKLKSENGAINVRDVSGRLNLNSINRYGNRVRVLGFSGQLTANVINSDTYLEGDFEKIFAQGKGGKVFLTLPENANATIRAGSLGFTGNYKPGSRIQVGGLNLTKEDAETWRVGEGGAPYIFNVEGSEITLRSMASIRTR